MKKIIAIFTSLFIAIVMFAGPAMANGNHGTEYDGKPVTLCHYDGSNNNGDSGKYSKITVDFDGWFGSGSGNSGHQSHSNDIWEAFSYLKRTGSESWETVNVAAQGDTSRLAFDKCKVPDDNEKVAKPTAVYVDSCGTKNDAFSVAPGSGYTVGSVVTSGNTQSITVTLADDFVWSDGSSDAVTFTKPAFTDEDCDLPETGGTVTNTVGGIVVLGLLVVGVLFLLRRRTE